MCCFVLKQLLYTHQILTKFEPVILWSIVSWNLFNKLGLITQKRLLRPIFHWEHFFQGQNNYLLSDLLQKIHIFHMFLTVCNFFPLLMPKSKSLPSLITQPLYFKKRREWFALVALYKKVTLSDSLRLLITKEQLRELLFFISELLFSSQKTKNLLKNQWVNSQSWKILTVTLKLGMGIGSFAFHVTLFVKSESFPSHFLEEQNEQIAFFNTRAN